MALSQRNYEKIAEAIKTSPDKVTLVTRLCVYFGDDNPKFNADKFLDACYPQVLKVTEMP